MAMMGECGVRKGAFAGFLSVFRTALVVVVAVAAGGCGPSRDLFVGNWYVRDRPSLKMVIRPDGTGSLRDDAAVPNANVGGGFDFTWKMSGRQLIANFRAIAREYRGGMRDRVLVMEVANAPRIEEDGDFLGSRLELLRVASRD